MFSGSYPVVIAFGAVTDALSGRCAVWYQSRSDWRLAQGERPIPSTDDPQLGWLPVAHLPGGSQVQVAFAARLIRCADACRPVRKCLGAFGGPRGSVEVASLLLASSVAARCQFGQAFFAIVPEPAPQLAVAPATCSWCAPTMTLASSFAGLVHSSSAVGLGTQTDCSYGTGSPIPPARMLLGIWLSRFSPPSHRPVVGSN